MERPNQRPKSNSGFKKPAFNVQQSSASGLNNPKQSAQSTSWGQVADWYDGLLEGDEGGVLGSGKGNNGGVAGGATSGSDTYQSAVILPNLTRLLEPKTGMTILDLACGQGYFSRAWAEAGAKVIASDISKELVDIAIKKGGKNISYHVSPAHKAEFCESGSVDAVTCVLAIQNIENLNETVAEASRVLKAGGKGRAYFVLNHPAFRIPKRSEWGYDESTKVQYRRLDGYMSESRTSIDMHPGQTAKKLSALSAGQISYDKPRGGSEIAKQVMAQSTVSFHRPLQVYMKAFFKAGLLVRRMEEWTSHRKSLPGPKAQVEDTSRKEFPLFMCIEVVKV